MSIQTRFRAALLAPDIAAPAGLITPQGTPADRRFNIYRNNVTVALGNALAASFPVVQKLLGPENFKVIAGIYLRQHPPNSPVMARYGDGFPTFLEQAGPLQHLGYLGDVARLENLMRQAYHSGDADPFDSRRLAQFDPADLAQAQITLAPSLRLISSRWPLFDIWQYNTQELPEKPGADAQDVVVLRPQFDPVPLLLPPGGYAFLRALQAGVLLQDAQDTALSSEASFDLSALLGLLLAHDAIKDIHIKFHTRSLQ